MKHGKTTLLLLLAILLQGCASHPVAPAHPTPTSRQVTQKLLGRLHDWQGTRYAWGGNSKAGIDCSAFVQSTYQELFAIELPRSTSAQRQVGQRISMRFLQPGDLVFFRPTWKTRHVGIYLGDDQFIHASTTKGVTRSSLKAHYWRKHLTEARRVLRN
jgi:cell wall-associated NlpC family hydrolase